MIINELIKVVNKLTDYNANKILFNWSKGILTFTNNTQDLFQSITNLDFNNITGFFYPQKNIIEFSYGDDRSDIRNILNMQKCVKDIIKSKILNINDSTKIKVMGDALYKSFKINNVKQLIDLKYLNFSHIIPFCYHGTDSYRLKFIKKNGILPLKQIDKKLAIKNFDKGYLKDSNKIIYLSIDFVRAHYYAENSTIIIKEKQKIKARPVVIEIHNLPAKYIVQDDDFSTMSMLSLLFTQDAKNKNSAIKSIRLHSQFGYTKSIPPNMFYKIHLL